MDKPGSISHLVVDAAAFLKNVQLHEIGEKIYTLHEVVNEIKDKQTKERLQVLPYELIFKTPSPDDIKAVTEFSKKTGDYPTLSATDLKVLALTHQLHRENVGLDEIRKEPQKIKDASLEKNDKMENLPGFYTPSQWKTVEVNVEDNDTHDYQNEIEEGNLPFFEDDEDDESSWLTPDNVHEAIKDLGLLTLNNENIKVGCITADFAMQNVLLQMGLNVLAVDGKVIKEARTYILRCHGCYKTTTKMTLRFCPHCGNQTLKRVQVNVNENGEISLKINNKRPINVRGKKYSLPMPKGGKHSSNPILCADQPMPHNRLSNKALRKTDALNPEYIADNSPFAMNDVYSRSAQLNVGKCGKVIRGNPNKVRGPGKSRK